MRRANALELARARAHGLQHRELQPFVLIFAQPAGCADEIFNLGSQHPNGGSTAIPVDMLTDSSARERAPRTTLHLTTCATRAQAIRAAGARADRVGAESPTRRLKEALDHAARGIYQSGELNKTSWRVRRLRRGCPVPGP